MKGEKTQKLEHIFHSSGVEGTLPSVGSYYSSLVYLLTCGSSKTLKVSELWLLLGACIPHVDV